MKGAPHRISVYLDSFNNHNMDQFEFWSNIVFLNYFYNYDKIEIKKKVIFISIKIKFFYFVYKGRCLILIGSRSNFVWISAWDRDAA